MTEKVETPSLDGGPPVETTSLQNKRYRTYRPATCAQENRPYDLPTSEEVYKWPEFQALAKRLGIVWEKGTTKLTITLDQDHLVLVAHDYHGEERHLPQPLPETDEEWARDNRSQPPSERNDAIS